MAGILSCSASSSHACRLEGNKPIPRIITDDDLMVHTLRGYVLGSSRNLAQNEPTNNVAPTLAVLTVIVNDVARQTCSKQEGIALVATKAYPRKLDKNEGRNMDRRMHRSRTICRR